MIEIKTIEGTYRVWFEHLGDFFKEQWKPSGTQCRIDLLQEEGGWVTVGEGSSFCHPHDQFRKEEGRRLSLERAVNMAFPEEKSVRKQFWEAYEGR